MPGILKLPCPDLAHLPASSKSNKEEVDEHKRWRPFSHNQTPPLSRSQARRKPSAVYSSTLGMLSIPALFYPPLGLTNLVGVTKFLEYAGVRYRLDSPYYLWLFVRYDDLAEGYVGVPSLSFNANVSLQQELKVLVPRSEWQDLQEKYGFGFIDQMM